MHVPSVASWKILQEVKFYINKMAEQSRFYKIYENN